MKILTDFLKNVHYSNSIDIHLPIVRIQVLVSVTKDTATTKTPHCTSRSAGDSRNEIHRHSTVHGSLHATSSLI